MTYIVSGQLNSKPFIMVDCVASIGKGESKTYHFRSKLKRLTSTKEETYYCFTGVDSYNFAISNIDENLFFKKNNFDFKNYKQIEDVLDLSKKIITRPEYLGNSEPQTLFCRIYFIDRTGVYYYQINDKGQLSEIEKIKDGFFIDSEFSTNTQFKIVDEIENNEQLIKFSKDNILTHANKDYKIDLKDKFNYVIFDNNILSNNGLDNNRDIMLSIVTANYNEIE